MRSTALLLLLAVTACGLAHAKPSNVPNSDPDELQSQIERPPSEGQAPPEPKAEDILEVAKTTEKGFDIEYTVKRPVSEELEELKEKLEKRKICLEKEKIENIDGDIEEFRCVRDAPLTPYIHYKKYKTWQRRPLFIIIIGGLRWDYLLEETWENKSAVRNMKAFSWVKRHGTTLKQVVPVFPPYDLPTWTSLATGLYPESTGVTGDYMLNLKTRDLFARHESDSLDSWWVEGEPIWSVAAKHGRNVSVLNWHDCKLPGKSIENPRDCRPFVPNMPLAKKQELVRLFNHAFTKIHKDGYDLSIVYTDFLKKIARIHGPDSPEVLQGLKDLDDVLQDRLSDIKNKKERADLKLNILVLSDYGLNSKVNTTKVLLDDYVNFKNVQYVIQRGGSAVLVPYALKTGEILRGFGDKLGVANMDGVDAYVRDVNLETPPLEYPLFPEELRYGAHTWNQDILLVARPGFEIEINETLDKLLPPQNQPEMGTSGYHPDPPKPQPKPKRDKHKTPAERAQEKLDLELYENFGHSMKTVGFAWGPDFLPGYESEPIQSVDIYQILAFLLEIPPNDHDGSWDRVRSMLMINGSPNLGLSWSALAAVITVAFFNYLS